MGFGINVNDNVEIDIFFQIIKFNAPLKIHKHFSLVCIFRNRPKLIVFNETLNETITGNFFFPQEKLRLSNGKAECASFNIKNVP